MYNFSEISSKQSGLAPVFILTFEARRSFFMACIIPRRPWQPDVSLRPGPAAGELSCDAASELGMMLMLSEAEALSRMPGSAPCRQLRVFRLLWGGGGFNSSGGAKGRQIKIRKAKGWRIEEYNFSFARTQDKHKHCVTCRLNLYIYYSQLRISKLP